MRSAGTTTTAILLAASVFGILGPAPATRATTKEEVAINGRYRVTSIGNWAKIKDQYNQEPTVVSTWTISTTCSNFSDMRRHDQERPGLERAYLPDRRAVVVRPT